ncbi:NUDIX hydrolase [Candidatus Pacearchaeota archaeon]|nr:NUDIX hydrolase [Candidatus Pacearchaeota archaeon]
MPKSVSKKQFRFMQAIMHGKNIDHPRGTPPKSVANKYSSPGKGAKEQSGQNRGGDWNKSKDKKKKKGLKKCFEQYYKGQGAGVIVTNEKGQVLVGKGHDGTWQTPGGHVDPGEDYVEAAHRELREEANIVAGPLNEVGHFRHDGNDSKVFQCDIYTGKVKDSDELKELKFVDLHSLLDWNLRECSKIGLEMYAQSSLKKSSNLKDMLTLEKLEKNILRGADQRQVVYDVSHGEALRLVGNGCWRWLSKVTADMGDEDFRDVKVDTYTLALRKHSNDVYSGRISDGHKVVHQFTNKSLPQLCADVMSVFEWYSDEDEHVFDLIDEDNLPDDAIHGGLEHLSDNYKKHNLANIYTEMENIRGEIRNGMAVDLQQVEHKIMGLFDQLEEAVHDVAEKHNQLVRDAGSEVEILEGKLRDLQSKVDELNSKPTTVEAYQARPVNNEKVYGDHYMYLPKPKIEVGGNGKVTITFEKDWTDMEKSNFLSDVKAKIIRGNDARR